MERHKLVYYFLRLRQIYGEMERDKHKSKGNSRKNSTAEIFEDFCRSKSPTFEKIDMERCSFVAKTSMMIYAYNCLFSPEERRMFQFFLSKKNSMLLLSGESTDESRKEFEDFIDALLVTDRSFNCAEASNVSWKEFLIGQAQTNEDQYVMSFLFKNAVYVEEELNANPFYNAQLQQNLGRMHLLTTHCFYRVCDTEPFSFPSNIQYDITELEVEPQKIIDVRNKSSNSRRLSHFDLLVCFPQDAKEKEQVPKKFAQLCRFIPTYKATSMNLLVSTDTLLDSFLIQMRGQDSIQKKQLCSRGSEIYKILHLICERKIILDQIVSSVLLMENNYSWFILYDNAPSCFREQVFQKEFNLHWPIMTTKNRSGISSYESVSLYFPENVNNPTHIAHAYQAVECAKSFEMREEMFLENVKKLPISINNEARGKTVFEFADFCLLSVCLLIHLNEEFRMPVQITVYDVLDSGPAEVTSVSGKDAFISESFCGQWYAISLRKRSLAKNALLYQIQRNYYVNPPTRFEGETSKIVFSWPPEFDNTKIDSEMFDNATRFYIREQNVVRGMDGYVGRIFS